MVESAVKTVTECVMHGQRDNQHSTTAAIGTNLRKEIVDRTTRQMIHEKAEMGEAYKKESNIKARGTASQEQTCNLALERHAKIIAIERKMGKVPYQEMFESIETSLMDRNKAFSKSLSKKKIKGTNDQLELNMEKVMGIPKALLLFGYDKTSLQKGQFEFTDLVKDKHWDCLVTELEQRNIEVPLAWNWSQTRDKLEDASGEGATDFEPLTKTLDEIESLEKKTQTREIIRKKHLAQKIMPQIKADHPHNIGTKRLISSGKNLQKTQQATNINQNLLSRYYNFYLNIFKYEPFSMWPSVRASSFRTKFLNKYYVVMHCSQNLDL